MQFLDGGYRDNMPTALAQKMGAEELVCVDLEGVGITLPNRTGLPTTMIRSYWELGDILHFDPDTARRNMELGYYDTRRAMGYLRAAPMPFPPAPRAVRMPPPLRGNSSRCRRRCGKNTP